MLQCLMICELEQIVWRLEASIVGWPIIVLFEMLLDLGHESVHDVESLFNSR